VRAALFDVGAKLLQFPATKGFEQVEFIDTF
jgi:hypothetical protein